ncbi:YncE family protein [Silvibacterium sp.]|uniref:YncE family protein n=1 Tax=Silvibacterium sp. TaxID=1964179 RepID=UPI0039E33A0D
MRNWILILLAAVGAMVSYGQEPSVGLLNRSAIAVNQRTRTVYAVDTARNALEIMPASGPPHRVNVGAGPVAVAVNETTGRVYVLCDGPRAVWILDEKDKVLTKLPTAARPYGIGLDETANKVYISNTFSPMLTVIDGATNTARNVKAAFCDMMLVDSASHRVYLLNYESDSLSVFDTVTNTVTKLSAGKLHQWGMAVYADTLYVSHPQDGSIGLVDEKTRAVREVKTGAWPCAVAADTKHGAVWVTNYTDGTVTAIRNGRAIATLRVGTKPAAVAVDESADRVYVANEGDGTVSVIEANSRRVLRTLAAGQHPYALAVEPSSHRVYAANAGGGATVVDVD